MAQLNMARAFHAKMITTLSKFTVTDGTYDDNNDWIKGATVEEEVRCIIKPGNKFSQFEEGVALHNLPGGKRYSDYRTIYINHKYSLQLEDKILYRGQYFNVLQKSDYSEFNFEFFLIEVSKDWVP